MAGLKTCLYDVRLDGPRAAKKAAPTYRTSLTTKITKGTNGY